MLLVLGLVAIIIIFIVYKKLGRASDCTEPIQAYFLKWNQYPNRTGKMKMLPVFRYYINNEEHITQCLDGWYNDDFPQLYMSTLYTIYVDPNNFDRITVHKEDFKG